MIGYLIDFFLSMSWLYKWLLPKFLSFYRYILGFLMADLTCRFVDTCWTVWKSLDSRFGFPPSLKPNNPIKSYELFQRLQSTQLTRVIFKMHHFLPRRKKSPRCKRVVRTVHSFAIITSSIGFIYYALYEVSRFTQVIWDPTKFSFLSTAQRLFTPLLFIQDWCL